MVVAIAQLRPGEGYPRTDCHAVSIAFSSAVVKAIAEGTIEWETDPDFGYEVAASLPGIDDLEILQPRRLYERTGRGAEHAAIVERLRTERRDCLAAYPGLRSEIAEAVGG